VIAPAFSSASGKEVDTPPSIAQGGNGVVTPGCPACRKRLFTMANFMDHLADDVLPPLSDKISKVPRITQNPIES
jgi:hypothetical protein